MINDAISLKIIMKCKKLAINFI